MFTNPSLSKIRSCCLSSARLAHRCGSQTGEWKSYVQVYLQLYTDVRVGPQRRLSTGELMLLNHGVGEDSSESIGLQGDPTSPSWLEGNQELGNPNFLKEISPEYALEGVMLKLKHQYFGHLM